MKRSCRPPLVLGGSVPSIVAIALFWSAFAHPSISYAQTAADARMPAAAGDIGNDFGVVTIRAGLAALIRPSIPVFGGPTTVEDVAQGQPLCHDGDGVIVGETFLTMARVGDGAGSTPTY